MVEVSTYSENVRLSKPVSRSKLKESRLGKMVSGTTNSDSFASRGVI